MDSKMTTVYSFKQIEDYIRSLGWITLDSIEYEDGLAKANTIRKVVDLFIKNMRESDRFNERGENEGYYTRSTIKDIYRAVIKKIPHARLQKVYEKVYKRLGRKNVYSFVCEDIKKRVYENDDGKYSPFFLAHPSQLTDEFGVELLPLMQKFAPNFLKFTENPDDLELTHIPNVNASDKP